MHFAFAVILTAFVLALSTIIPPWLLAATGRMQHEFDLFLLQPDACRSDYPEKRFRLFLFTSGNEIPCPLRRGDFAAPGSGNKWPYSVCVLLDAADLPLPGEGADQCDYR